MDGTRKIVLLALLAASVPSSARATSQIIDPPYWRATTSHEEYVRTVQPGDVPLAKVRGTQAANTGGEVALLATLEAEFAAGGSHAPVPPFTLPPSAYLSIGEIEVLHVIPEPVESIEYRFHIHINRAEITRESRLDRVYPDGQSIISIYPTLLGCDSCTRTGSPFRFDPSNGSLADRDVTVTLHATSPPGESIPRGTRPRLQFFTSVLAGTMKAVHTASIDAVLTSVEAIY